MIRHQTQLLGARPVNHMYILIHRLGIDNKDLYWSVISFNKGITEAIVVAHPDWSWDFYRLSANINISWQFILDHPDLPWIYSAIVCNNKDITLNIIVDHPKLREFGHLFTHNDNAERFINLDCDDLSGYKYYQLACKNVGFADLIKTRDIIINMIHAIILNNKRLITRIYKNYPKSKYSLEQILADAVICYCYLRSLNVADKCKKYFKIVDKNNNAYQLYLSDLIQYAKLLAKFASRNPNILADEVLGLRNDDRQSNKNEVSQNIDNQQLGLWDINELLKNPAISVSLALDLFYNTVDEIKISCVGNKKKWKNMEGVVGDLFNSIAYHPYVDNLMFKSHPKFTDDLNAFMKYNNSGNIYNAFDGTTMFFYKNPHMNHQNLYYFYKLHRHFEFDNNCDFDLLIRLKYLARKYFDIWIMKACIRRRMAVYECCVHELKMRFRDAEKMIVYVHEI